MSLSTIIKISRPRFWLYLAGTYLVGYSFGINNITQLNSFYFFLHFLYFLIPANIFLYGVNDIADEDTDKHNTKKQDYEHLLMSEEKRILVSILLGCIGITFVLLSFQPKIEAQFILSLFIILSFFYSVKPLRFKARPFVDFASNILYILPGILAYYQLTETFPNIFILLALFCWTSAMHLFSAIPDIDADKKANLKTTAILFGKKYSLIICTIFWTITAITALFTISSYFAIVAVLYPLIPLFLLFRTDLSIKRVYRFFPLLNALSGFLLFLYAIL